MFLQFSDWFIVLNTELNVVNSAEERENHCVCPWCRNFYRTVDAAYPDLRCFLSKFGAHIEAPESLQPVTKELYQATYCVEGKILRYGSEPIFVDDLPITIESDEQFGVLLIQVGLMNLPWVLEEKQEEIAFPSGSFEWPSYLT